jgi:Phage capsid protein
MAITGNTELAATKMDLIAAMVQKELAFQAKLMPYVTDVSQYAEPGLKKILFPKIGTTFTVEKRVSAAAGTPQALAVATDELALDENAYISWLIDSTDKLQSRIDVQAEYARKAASSHGRQVDTDIFTEAAATAGLVIAGGALTAAKVLQAQEFMLNAVEQEEMMQNSVLLVSPAQRTELLKVAEFSRADAYGSAVINSGIVGSLYGVPVVVHRALTGFQAYMWHKESMVIGFQKAPSYEEEKAISYGTGAFLAAMDQVYGVDAMEIAQAGAAAGKSPLIVQFTA